MKRAHWRYLATGILAVVTLALLAAACAPAATPTPTPTKAPAAATPTAAAKVEPTKPAATAPPAAPAATPTTAAVKPGAAPIKIGYITPLSGPVAVYGFTESIDVGLALEDAEKTGGINGYPVQLIRFDSPFDPKQAVTGMRKLVNDDKVVAVLGPFSSGELDVVAPLANEFQVPLISMKSTKPGISQQFRPWVFRVHGADDNENLSALVDVFKKRNPNVKRIVITGDTKDAVAQNAVTVIWPQLLKQAGYEVLGTVGYESGAQDFAAIVTKIKDMKPEAIAYAAGLPGNPVGFAKELARQEVKAPVIAAYWFLSGPVLPQAGKAMEGWLSTANIDPDEPDAKLQAAWKRRVAKADADANIPKPMQKAVEMMAYDATAALVDVMRKARITPEMPLQEARTKIRDGYQSIKDFDGLGGKLTMKPSGDAGWPPKVVFIVGDGTWKTLK